MPHIKNYHKEQKVSKALGIPTKISAGRLEMRSATQMDCVSSHASACCFITHDHKAESLTHTSSTQVGKSVWTA